MPNPIIEVKNIGKKYNITHQQGKYIALRDVLTNILKSPLKFLAKKTKQMAGIGGKEEFWALKNINFTVEKGEVIGIIGHNGAGKSTLLKILSQITPPTEGEIVLNGRVGSLLEVGTGFHPELTGRENIFLNGAILGMPRKEIAEKFDKIVEFAGIEKFLDTPVKYYSSGMYVRLAFSVAAHLEPDILIVDEVLAVGDADFQKKCLGKMDEITRQEGRTVLFVSHNLEAIRQLCPRCILLNHGKILAFDETEKVIDNYMSSTIHATSRDAVFTNRNKEGAIEKAILMDENNNIKGDFVFGEKMKILVNMNKNFQSRFGLELRIKNGRSELVGYASSWISGVQLSSQKPIIIELPPLKLVKDFYYVDFMCRIPLVADFENWWDQVVFRVSECRPGKSPLALELQQQLGTVVMDDVKFSNF